MLLCQTLALRLGSVWLEGRWVGARCDCWLDVEVTPWYRAKYVLLKPPICSSLHTDQSPSLPWASGAVLVPSHPSPLGPGPSLLTAGPQVLDQLPFSAGWSRARCVQWLQGDLTAFWRQERKLLWQARPSQVAVWLWEE